MQNIFLVLASYVFYGWWDWRFLSLIIFSSSVDYIVALALNRQDDALRRKVLLWISIGVNIGFLGFFKYYNFFAESFADAFTILGTSIDPARLNIILPVGISFYTFQTLSYTIDVYRKKQEATSDVTAFFAFVSFFPQLVAGPIERATNLLPQFFIKRQFDYEKAVDGMRQILLGLFKKIVIADNCAIYVNDIFANYQHYSGSTLLLGAMFFAFQIYADFSGYSDIAIGTSRLFGFNLKQNFAFPYFSRDIAEFWRRWHISLSTWFRDYVYIPLGGSRGGTWMNVRNVFVIFLVSGFWHGANWTFLTWGFLNACYFLPLLLLNKNRTHTNTVAEGSTFASTTELLQIFVTFLLTVLAWVFFRAETVGDALNYISGIFSRTLFTIPDVLDLSMWLRIMLIFLFIGLEWMQRTKLHALELTHIKKYRPYRWGLYAALLGAIMLFQGKPQEFIYFQF